MFSASGYLALTALLVAVSSAEHPFLLELYDEAYREVQRLASSTRVSNVIDLDEAGYRRLVLPGNPYFRSVVYFYLPSEEHQLQVLDVFAAIANGYRVNKQPDSNTKNGENRVFFFKVNMSDESTDWIRHVHKMPYLPDIIRFGLGNTVLKYDTPMVERFNDWITRQKTNLQQWTTQQLAYFMRRFCIESPKAVVATATPMKQLMEILNEIWAFLIANKLIFAAIVGLTLALLYLFLKHQRGLLTVLCIAFYAVNTSCVISALMMHSSYRRHSVKPLGRIYDWVMARLFTDSAKTQYLHEGIVVNLIVLSVSGSLFLLSNYVDNGTQPVAGALAAILALGIAALIVIVDHKKIPHSFDFLPSIGLPRGRIDVDRGYLF